MLIEHYGFREHPFLMTPDARLFFASEGHSRAYAHLIYGLSQREGFVIITGEVGAGKTTLIERLCGELDPNLYAVARVATSQVGGEDLLRLAAAAFRAPMEGAKAQVLQGLGEALKAGAAAGRRHLLIVDEAQALSPSALEELRMLSNITDGPRPLLQTLLLGQPQLRRIIASPDLDQLRQRVLASYHLGGLSEAETAAYIAHRLRAVGWEGRPEWGPGALALVHRFSGGIPRRINRLCSRVLLSAALEAAEALSAALVEATAVELDDDLGGGGASGLLDAANTADPLLAPMGGGLANGMGLGAGPAGDGRAMLDRLEARVDALERSVERREKVFNRLMDLFGEMEQRRAGPGETPTPFRHDGAP